jgi:hypothetical protein
VTLPHGFDQQRHIRRRGSFEQNKGDWLAHENDSLLREEMG